MPRLSLCNLVNLGNRAMILLSNGGVDSKLGGNINYWYACPRTGKRVYLACGQLRVKNITIAAEKREVSTSPLELSKDTSIRLHLASHI